MAKNLKPALPYLSKNYSSLLTDVRNLLVCVVAPCIFPGCVCVVAPCIFPGCVCVCCCSLYLSWVCVCCCSLYLSWVCVCVCRMVSLMSSMYYCSTTMEGWCVPVFMITSRLYSSSQWCVYDCRFVAITNPLTLVSHSTHCGHKFNHGGCIQEVHSGLST